MEDRGVGKSAKAGGDLRMWLLLCGVWGAYSTWCRRTVPAHLTLPPRRRMENTLQGTLRHGPSQSGWVWGVSGVPSRAFSFLPFYESINCWYWLCFGYNLSWPLGGGMFFAVPSVSPPASQLYIHSHASQTNQSMNVITTQVQKMLVHEC